MLLPFFQQKWMEAGCDEAGRGCLAGPVFAASVILPKSFCHPLLNDSKLVKPEDRETLRLIIEEQALAYAVGSIDNEEIDKINILKASFKAMHLAIGQLSMRPELLLIDGNHFVPYPGVPHHCIIKGDGKYASIAAASILAKTYRDAYMNQLHVEFPDYGWNENKGYSTPGHRKAIRAYGSTRYHRHSFRLLPDLPELF